MSVNKEANRKLSQNALTLAALGVVFGDIGTSPLYAVREAFHGPYAMAPTPENILGILSLVLWSLILVISVKYLLFVMRADNKGEGGVLALTALAALPKTATPTFWNRAVLYLGLFGSALLFGDGVITPAISVLSAVEGLKIATPLFEPLVIVITIAILAGLFLAQYQGTELIGKVFGPVIFLWFGVLGTLGVHGIVQYPTVLMALSPQFAFEYFLSNGLNGISVLGAVFLVVTGGEALYADMGHLGRKPIQRAWFFVALPGLVLNYFGQGALLLMRPEASENPFYLLAPSWALYPLVTIATMATVIASQALISGVFSLTRQAVQLGYAPRVRIVHTSSHEIGQIYIPQINWILFVLTCWCVFSFKSSSALASAYGIAVSSTMVITTLLTCRVASRRWNWHWTSVAGVLALFLSIDLVFFSANVPKIAEGGWFPLILGAVIFTLMTTWSSGRKILMQRLREKSLPLTDFLKKADSQNLAQVQGTAIFMTGDPEGTPLALIHNVKHNKCLHEKNALLTVTSCEEAHVDKSERIDIKTVRKDFYRVIAKYGFMETPDIHDILRICKEKGVVLNLIDITFFVGRETLLASDHPGMAIWREHLFSFMSKNAERATAYFNIPNDQVIEVGIQVKI